MPVMEWPARPHNSDFSRKIVERNGLGFFLREETSIMLFRAAVGEMWEIRINREKIGGASGL